MKQLFYTSLRYAFTLLLVYLSLGASAQKLYNVSDDHLAIQGYDVVAYFSDHSATEGKKEFSYSLDGATYRFNSQQHLQSFKAEPDKYKPQYGGWCAYAMGATGEKVDVDPETFKLINGKLYLFYNRFFNNTKKAWDKDEINLKQKADANWQKVAAR